MLAPGGNGAPGGTVRKFCPEAIGPGPPAGCGAGAPGCWGALGCGPLGWLATNCGPFGCGPLGWLLAGCGPFGCGPFGWLLAGCGPFGWPSRGRYAVPLPSSWATLLASASGSMRRGWLGGVCTLSTETVKPGRLITRISPSMLVTRISAP
ncbi:MAG: hypothetical protein EXQ87_02555 [Alphaproteobacteria bacterium]|nr:hypothetical protein [Alphaproteobacteria bacterium]